MKKNIVIKLLGTLFIVSFFVLLFMRVNTDIYVWNYSDFSIPIDIQLKIDDKLIFKDSLRSSSFFPNIIIRMKLRYGVHKINISSKKADVNQENIGFLFPNQLYIEFLGADTLGMGKEALTEYNSIIETFPGVFCKRIPSRTRSSFGNSLN
ncbi:hypothetical protein INE81_02042 [Bacteroides salyersiae]|uniref:hypothetical protein n=1 Tax=Bacteroides salyersiae TaxID=291644 RepID=UPI00189AA862|nr:hypothetical protein [Bacteroides salyersiae]MCS2404946.1 hypothetical protein [Bacteroides salyersiae]QUT75582.1 hypothetical protein INE81_02042 [Bacteroides salyersiae]